MKGVFTMLYLNANDISRVIDHEEVISIIENAMRLYEEGDYVQPDRITVNRNDKETYLYMPCFTEKVKGTKFLTLFADNAKKGIPTIQGLMMLNDNETGKVKCMMEGSALTAFRTGAVGGCGIRHTTPENVTKLGIVGTGVQGFHQCLYATRIRPIKDIYVFDIFEDKAKEFKAKLEAELPDVNVHVESDVENLVKQAEVIVTVTTSPKPVLPNKPELLKGKHFIGIGSYKPTMQEYPQAIFETLDQIYIDVDFAKEETGDLATPIREGWFKEENIKTLGKVLDSKIDVSGTTFYKSVGMALFDIMVAEYIYQRAVKLNVGTNLD